MIRSGDDPSMSMTSSPILSKRQVNVKRASTTYFTHQFPFSIFQVRIFRTRSFLRPNISLVQPSKMMSMMSISPISAVRSVGRTIYRNPTLVSLPALAATSLYMMVQPFTSAASMSSWRVAEVLLDEFPTRHKAR